MIRYYKAWSAILNENISIIGRVFADLGLPDNFVGLFWTVLGIQVAEVTTFIDVIDDVGKVDSISHQACCIHEMIRNFKTTQQSHLNQSKAYH